MINLAILLLLCPHQAISCRCMWMEWSWEVMTYYNEATSCMKPQKVSIHSATTSSVSWQALKLQRMNKCYSLRSYSKVSSSIKPQRFSSYSNKILHSGNDWTDKLAGKATFTTYLNASQKVWSVLELQTLPAGTKPRTSWHHWSFGGDRHERFRSTRRSCWKDEKGPSSIRPTL